MTTITIACESGPREVEATVVGDWAVHPMEAVWQIRPRCPWVITYAPTGKYLKVEFEDEADALSHAASLRGFDPLGEDRQRAYDRLFRDWRRGGHTGRVYRRGQEYAPKAVAS